MVDPQCEQLSAMILAKQGGCCYKLNLPTKACTSSKELTALLATGQAFLVSGYDLSADHLSDTE